VLKHLAAGGTKLAATRSTGFNHIDVGTAEALDVKVVRVTDYSPNSVAEFAVGLLLALNRRIPRAYNRTRGEISRSTASWALISLAALWP
jgi:D-lactate dehydrogenase